MTFGASFGRTFSPSFQPQSQKAVDNKWWLAGGVSAADCVAAYQAKGAADYASSKVNLANPGTYNATDGPAYPAWDAANGWKKSAYQYIKTGVTVANGQALIARFSNAGYADRNCCAGGGPAYGKGIALMAGIASNKHAAIYSSGYVYSGLALASGVMAVTPKPADATKWQSYVNGSLDTTDQSINTENFGGEYWLCANSGDITGQPIYVQAVAIYSIALTAAQISALSAAMAAL